MSKALAVEMDGAQASRMKRAPVLLPALVPQAFDYRVPEAAEAGSLVEATLAGKKRTGAVWDGPTDAALPDSKVKPVHRLLGLPPLKKTFRDFLEWVSEYTLAPKGAVLSLCGLAYAGKTTRTAFKPPNFSPSLPTLTPTQATVSRQILSDTKPAVLDGVTGSGKTEVYFHAMAEMLAAGKQVLVLLPEIALTHQWLERFARNFGGKPTVWHSQQTPAARTKAWQATLTGEAKIIVGARSALFLPFADLGLIVVDEEHDPSYKQEDGVLYHARDMAVVRAHFERIPILLVSATPSLETMINIDEGKYRALHLPERFGAAGMPSVSVIDLRTDAPERGDFLSPSVKREMLATLARGEQSLLFLNRRGYAPLLLCRGCGHRFQCADCSAWLVVHGKNARLECHHCGHREPMPKECPNCKADAEKLAACGPGVERIADEVRAMFANIAEGVRRVAEGEPPREEGQERSDEGGGLAHPFTPEGRTIKIAVLSSDEAVAAETWAAIEAGEIDILVGTQMVAKGHHFPRLTFVAVVDSDMGLQGADLRAGERTYQLLHQLGGRAGRGDAPGTVFIQTYQSEHPVMQALLRHDRDAVMQLERNAREAGGWPPFGQLAAILLDGASDAEVRAAGQALARTAPSDPRIRVLGPAPAPLSKLRGQYRYRLLVKLQPGLHLQRTLRAWLDGQKFKGVRVKIDVNPYYFL